MFLTSRRYFRYLAFAVLLGHSVFAATKSSQRWQGQVAASAKDVSQWQTLLDTLLKQDFPYGALATARRLPVLFRDLKSKEMAYQALITLQDRGLPFSNSALFLGADLEPKSDLTFAANYHFYKGVANLNEGTAKWAEAHFKKVEGEDFPKFQLLSAIRLVDAKDIPGAEAKLKVLLAKKFPLSETSFVAKVARTLARLYFEEEEYGKAYDIYNTFLLRLNPVTPSDFLEAAWNLYHLKRYPEALGHLFNLEAPTTSSSDLERFLLRALIYRDNCDGQALAELEGSFQAIFGETVLAIKHGLPLASLPLLHTLVTTGNSEFRELQQVREHLLSESSQLDRLPASLTSLAKPIFDSEVVRLQTAIALRAEEGLQRNAAELVGLSENIKLLKFEVERAIYNPATVFQLKEKTAVVASEPGEDGLRWAGQRGYWRDERLRYRGLLTNLCAK